MFAQLTNTFRRVTLPPRPPFVVHVLGRAVEVVITDRELVDADGQPANAVADGNDRQILIAAAAPPALRLELLLYPAWMYLSFLVHLPTRHASVADLFALVAEPVFLDVAAQGGMAALMALEPADAGEVGHD